MTDAELLWFQACAERDPDGPEATMTRELAEARARIAELEGRLESGSCQYCGGTGYEPGSTGEYLSDIIHCHKCHGTGEQRP
jgi:DnaJ-class molecular chaperone